MGLYNGENMCTSFWFSRPEAGYDRREPMRTGPVVITVGLLYSGQTGVNLIA